MALARMCAAPSVTGDQVAAAVGAQALGNVWYRAKSTWAEEDGRRGEVAAGLERGDWTKAYLAAALCSDVWHRWKRSSFKPCLKTYLPDMAVLCCSWMMLHAGLEKSRRMSIAEMSPTLQRKAATARSGIDCSAKNSFNHNDNTGPYTYTYFRLIR